MTRFDESLNAAERAPEQNLAGIPGVGILTTASNLLAIDVQDRLSPPAGH